MRSQRQTKLICGWGLALWSTTCYIRWTLRYNHLASDQAQFHPQGQWRIVWANNILIIIGQEMNRWRIQLWVLIGGEVYELLRLCVSTIITATVAQSAQVATVTQNITRLRSQFAKEHERRRISCPRLMICITWYFYYDLYVFYYSYTESRNRTQATSVLVDRLAVNVH